jgi:hypothetical protein
MVDTDTAAPGFGRRSLLAALAGAGTASLAGCPASNGGGGGGDGGEDLTPTTTADPETASRLAERFAPTFAFDTAEQWLPTDPRSYTSERDGRTIVDGFDALNGYTSRYDEAGDPPEPTVFHHVVEYADSPLAVVQFWYYFAFDQFTTNFHWHDWEVLHVFVDTDTDDPQLFVASSHSERVPNNEHLDPDPDRVPRVLSELGSHSSALSLNDRRNSFQRLPLDTLPADITNRALDAVEQLAELPAAYGLPRDEGFRLPYVVPELDGTPVHEHPDLPAVDRDTLVPRRLTVRSFDALSSPPTDLPSRETGLVFAPDGDADADVTYDLVPTRDLENIDGFTGPQLSFEFAVPEPAENAVAGHITTAGTPWNQQRYDDPVADITEPAHRSELSDRYDAVSPPGPINDLVATVSETVRSPVAPDDEGVETTDASVEAVTLLQSDPVAAPTFRGVAMLRGVETGDHRLTVNGAGVAPHTEPITVGDGGETGATTDTTTTTVTAAADGTNAVTLAGVEGEIPLVPAGEATKLEVDADGTDADLSTLAVDDDFGGRLYEASVDGPDAVYVHRGGAYTAEVRDVDDAVGAFRVNPSGTDPVRIDRPRTGTASLASFVETLIAETTDRLGEVGDDDDDDDDDHDDDDTAGGGTTQTFGGLLRALEAVSGAAGRAADRAEAGDRGGSDRALEALASNLDRAIERFDGLRETLPADRAAATDRQLREAQRRTNQATAARKL